MNKKCDECGKEFEVDIQLRNWQHKKHCSEECQKSKDARKKRGKYQKQEWPQKRKCEWCDKEYLVEGPGGRPQQFCGRQCYLAKKSFIKNQEVENKRVPKKCLLCGSPFLQSKFHTSQMYCSDKCYFADRNSKSSNMQARYANQTEFARARRLVLKRDGKKCRFCGKDGKMHVHHLDNSGGKKDGNNHPDNLTTLCKRCHEAMHNINLVPDDNGWAVKGNIFTILNLREVNVITI